MLAPDVSAIQKAVVTLTSSQSLLSPYVGALLALQLGPQPLIVDGKKQGEFDPLANYPDLAEDLQDARLHVVIFGFNAPESLHGWAIDGLPSFNDTFQTRAAQLTAVINAIGEGSAPTPAERQTVTAALTAIADGLAQGAAVIAAAQQSLITFQNQFTGDHVSLTESDDSLNRIIPQLQQQIADDAARFIGTIGGGAIAMVIEQIGGQTLDQLTSLKSTLDDAVSASEGLGLGLTVFANLVATLSGKYAAVNTQVTEATDAQFASQLQALDVQVATQAWRQLTDFVAQSGL